MKELGSREMAGGRNAYSRLTFPWCVFLTSSGDTSQKQSLIKAPAFLKFFRNFYSSPTELLSTAWTHPVLSHSVSEFAPLFSASEFLLNLQGLIQVSPSLLTFSSFSGKAGTFPPSLSHSKNVLTAYLTQSTDTNYIVLCYLSVSFTSLWADRRKEPVFLHFSTSHSSLSVRISISLIQVCQVNEWIGW